MSNNRIRRDLATNGHAPATPASRRYVCRANSRRAVCSNGPARRAASASAWSTASSAAAISNALVGVVDVASSAGGGDLT